MVLVKNKRNVVLAVREQEERIAVTALLEELDMMVQHAKTGQDAVYMVEDHDCDFLVMDIQLVDMHAWKVLSTLKESTDLNELPTLVIMDDATVVPLSNVTPVVRPVSVAKLKNVILSLFSAQH